MAGPCSFTDRRQIITSWKYSLNNQQLNLLRRGCIVHTCRHHYTPFNEESAQKLHENLVLFINHFIISLVFTCSKDFHFKCRTNQRITSSIISRLFFERYTLLCIFKAASNNSWPHFNLFDFKFNFCSAFKNVSIIFYFICKLFLMLCKALWSGWSLV